MANTVDIQVEIDDLPQIRELRTAVNQLREGVKPLYAHHMAHNIFEHVCININGDWAFDPDGCLGVIQCKAGDGRLYRVTVEVVEE